MRIGIVGLGLIGGSLGIEFVKRGHEVLGVSRKAATCKRAIDKQVVTTASPDLASLAVVDIVFICTPIPNTLPMLSALAEVLSPTAIATDVASVKALIVDLATDIWPNFVGGHPMAGTASSGIEAAQADLFDNCTYVLTPTKRTADTAIAAVEMLVGELPVHVMRAAPDIHDAAVAWISHMPVFVSASLIAACSNAHPDELALARQLASSGFRDTSRVGGGNPELGSAMAELNHHAVLASLLSYRQHLDRAIAAIDHQDWPAVRALLEETQAQRPMFVDPA